MWFEERRFRGSILGNGAKLILVFRLTVEETCPAGSDLVDVDLWMEWMGVLVPVLVVRMLGDSVRPLSVDESGWDSEGIHIVIESLEPAPLLSADEVVDILPNVYSINREEGEDGSTSGSSERVLRF